MSDVKSIAVKMVAPELVMSAEFAAPRAAVFEAWTDKRLVSRWWAGSSFTMLSCEMDVRPGGAWRRLMRRPGGSVLLEYGVYREVVRPERLVFTYNSEGGPFVEPETVVTVSFAALGGDRTRLTLRHAPIETDAARTFHEGGWSRCFDRLPAAIFRR